MLFARAAWLWTACSMICCNDDAGGDPDGPDWEHPADMSLEKFRRSTEDTLLRAMRWIDGVSIASLYGRHSLERIFCDLAAFAYWRSAFLSESYGLANFVNRLRAAASRRDIEPGQIHAEVNEAFEDYYNFMVHSLVRMLTKHSYKIVDDINFPAFEEIGCSANLGELTELLDLMADSSRIFDRISADRMPGTLKPLSLHLAEFECMVTNHYRQHSPGLDSLVSQLEGNPMGEVLARLDEHIRAASLDSSTGPDIRGHAMRVAMKVDELRMKKACVRMHFRRLHRMIGQAVAEGARSGHPCFADGDFSRSVRARLLDLLGESPVDTLALPYARCYLDRAMRQRLAFFIQYAMGRTEVADGDALMDMDLRFAVQFRSLSEARLQSKLRKYLWRARLMVEDILAAEMPDAQPVLECAESCV